MLALALAAGAGPVVGCSKENQVDQSTNVNNSGCTTPATDLAKLCPPGTSLEVTSSVAVGESVCPGGEGEVKDGQGKTTGVCRTFAGCSVRCQATCECGVKSATTTSVECSPCATCQPGEVSCAGSTLLLCGPDGKQVPTDCAKAGQVCSSSLGQCVTPNQCGNSVCEASEDETKCPQDCKKACGDGVCSGVETATTCPADCLKSVCGNSKCEMGETTSCPQDCGTVCVSGAKSCVGTKLMVCQPDGKAEKEFDCADFGQTCGQGTCVLPAVCGNGACEASDPAGCADCATTCGNGTCEAGETVETCSTDCKKATCGDGKCAVSEAGTGCADCAASCGNGACDSGESRSTCPKDCGYCGDGKCPSNEETAVQPAPEGLDPCPEDCVKTGCSSDADCNDQIGCTLDRCVSGKCAYDVPPDGSGTCGAGHLCVKFFGCCPDADGDGYPCCGGSPDGKGCQSVSAVSDCADQDKSTNPGATSEVCGGPDVNCNAKNEPVVDLKPTFLTSDQNSKAGLGVAFDGQHYLLGWLGKPNGVDAVVIALADKKGTLVEGPTVLTEDPLYATGFQVRVSPSPDHQGFAVAWSTDAFAHADTAARVTWVDKKLQALTWPPVSIKNSPGILLSKLSHRFQLTHAQGYYLVSGSAHYNNYNRHLAVLLGPAETPVATLENADTFDSEYLDSVSVLDGKFVLVGNFAAGKPGFFSVSPEGVPSPTVAINWTPGSEHYSGYDTINTGQGAIALAHRHKGTSAVGILSRATQPNTSGLYYSVVNLGGNVLYQQKVYANASASPVALALAPDPAQSDPHTGVLGMLARVDGNLVFLSRGPDGEQVVKDAIISGDKNLSDPTLIHDGTDFVAVWMQPKGGSSVPQVALSTVRCQ